MKRMCMLVITAVLLLLLAPHSFAEDAALLREQAEQSGATGLLDTLPEEVRDTLEDRGVSPEDASGIIDLSPGAVLEGLFSMVKKQWGGPLRILGSLVGILLLCAVLEGLRDTAGKTPLAETFQLVGVLACAGVIAAPVIECLTSAGEALRSGGNFLLAFVPVFSSVSAVSGSVSSSAAYYGILIVVAEGSIRLASGVLIPLLGAFLALSVTAAVCPQLNLTSLATGLRTAAVWMIGILATVFVGLLTVQGFAGSAVDSVGARAAKFAVSSAVPVVGSALSDAISAVRGSLGVLKTAVGGFGIVAGLLLLLPTILSTLLLRLSLGVAAFVGEALGASHVAALMKGAGATLMVVLAILACFCVMLVVSTAALLLLGLGI